MSRKFAVLALSALVLVTAACSSETPVSQPAPSQPKTSALPGDTALVNTPVTTPIAPTSIDPQLLPAKARLASASDAYTTEQKVCIDATLYKTLQADPTIEQVNGKLASAMGNAVVACTGDTFGTMFATGLAQRYGLSDEQKTCVQETLTKDRDAASAIVGATAVQDVQLILDALGVLETKCNFKVATG